MSRATRIGLVALAVAIAVVAFVIARPSNDEQQDAGERPSGTGTAEPRGDEARQEVGHPASPTFTLRVADGRHAGGPRVLEVSRDERVRLTVRSRDTSGEVHLHGYDISRDVAPRRPARFNLTADDTGIFEIELEETGTQIAELRVEP